MVTFVLADDHAIVRQGLRTLLESNPAFAVVGEAADGRQALQLVKLRKPTVLIADLLMPGVNGLRLAASISRLKVKPRVIILSMYGDDAYVLEAFRKGVAGYIAKESSGAELFQAIEEVLLGHRYLSPSISESKEAHAFKGPALSEPLDSARRFGTLTARERLELRLIVEGASNRDIADRLRVGLRAVQAHRTSLMRKLGFTTTGALITYALRRGVELKRTSSSKAKRPRRLVPMEST